MALIQTILGFLAALFVLVSVHEFGHFYVARLCGVKVLRFCIGMGKPFLSYRDKHNTEFGLAPFPLGGYVKMLDEREGEVAPEERHLSYNSKTVWQRIAILAAGPVANIILAIGIFWVLSFIGGASGTAPLIGAVEPGSMGNLGGLKPGQEIIAIDGKKTPTQQAVVEQLFVRLGETGELTMAVVAPGETSPIELTWHLDSWLADAKDPDPIAGLGAEFYLPPIVLGEVSEASPALAAGLQKGDQVVGLDGHRYTRVEQWIETVQKHPGQVLQLEIDRDGRLLKVDVTPASTTLADGSMVGQIGVRVGYGPIDPNLVRHQDFGLVQAFVHGLDKTASTTKFVLLSMKKLIFGEISTKNLSGPIGIAKVAGDQARAGFVYFIEFLAVLSIYLGVFNLFPIPVLDGGHILFCLIEAIKGSPVSERIQTFGLNLGLALLGGVMLVASYNDLLRF
jgi:regulator of sigma E protease